MTTMDPKMMAFVAEMASEYDSLLTKHFNAPGSTLEHHAPFGLTLTSIDGTVAEFMEDGVNLYPDEKKS